MDAAPEQQRGVIDAWRRNGWPAVARRADPLMGAGLGLIALGLPAPPDPRSGMKMRVALCVDAADAIRIEPPLPLSAAIDAAPDAWRAPLAALDAQAARQGLALRLYGSLAWQAMTAQPYVSAGSDIDVLCAVATHAQLDGALALLQAHARRLPLDGELTFPAGQAVAWKEWAGAAGLATRPRVLAKGSDAVSLMSMDALLNTLNAPGLRSGGSPI